MMHAIMEEQVNLYKNISIDIINALKNDDYEKIDCLLNKRQNIIEKYDNDKFKESLIFNGVLEIDKEIKELFDSKINKIKEDIKEHKKIQHANISYSNYNKENLNIFNKKV